MKLGRLAERHDVRTLRLAKYMPAEVTQAPDVVAWSRPVTAYPMAFNDREGCCAVASLYHSHLTACANTGRKPRIAVMEVDRVYRLLSGFNGRPETDTGLVMLDVLRWAKRAGWIEGYARVNERNTWHIRHACHMFGGLYTGAWLPRSIERQADHWTVENPKPDGVELSGDSKPGSLGGHAMHVPDVDGEWLGGPSWERNIRRSWGWNHRYTDEIWCVFWRDWLDVATQRSPPGFDFAQLLADLQAVST
jgi:hypothetical protein